LYIGSLLIKIASLLKSRGLDLIGLGFQLFLSFRLTLEAKVVVLVETIIEAWLINIT